MEKNLGLKNIFSIYTKTVLFSILFAQDFVWRNSPKIMIASTRTHLFNTCISEAIRPADHSTLVTVQIDKHGSVAFAAGIGEPKTSKHLDVDHLSIDSDNDAEMFRITKSALYFHDPIPVIN